MVQILEFLVYDDVCHLRNFANNPVRNTFTKIAQDITVMEIVVDKLHFKGPIDQRSRHNCNPNKFDQLAAVCTLFTMYAISISTG